VKRKKTIDFNLYLITDRKLVTRHSPASLREAGRASLVTAVNEALKGGVKAIQLREKDLGTREFLELAYKMRALTKKYNAKLFINDRLDIALAVEADGVHLAQNSIPADAVKKAIRAVRFTLNTQHQIPPHPPLTKGGWGDFYASRFLIGVSTHSLKEARDAEKAGADFITFGPVYRTASKLKYGAPLGIDKLIQITRKVHIPVFAIGGVKSNRIEELRKAGAYGVAMISEIFGAEDIRGKTKELHEIVEDIIKC